MIKDITQVLDFILTDESLKYNVSSESKNPLYNNTSANKDVMLLWLLIQNELLSIVDNNAAIKEIYCTYNLNVFDFKFSFYKETEFLGLYDVFPLNENYGKMVNGESHLDYVRCAFKYYDTSIETEEEKSKKLVLKDLGNLLQIKTFLNKNADYITTELFKNDVSSLATYESYDVMGVRKMNKRDDSFGIYAYDDYFNSVRVFIDGIDQAIYQSELEKKIIESDGVPFTRSFKGKI